MDAQKVSEYFSAVKREEFPSLRTFLKASELSAFLIRIFRGQLLLWLMFNKGSNPWGKGPWYVFLTLLPLGMTSI